METKIENLQHAKWAMFFRVLGISYEYMPAPRILPGGAYYQATFYLPTFNGGMFARCAENVVRYEEAARMKDVVEADHSICTDTKAGLMLLCGDPSYRVITYLWVDEEGKVQINEGLPNADQAEGEDRMFVEPGYQNGAGYVERQNYTCLGANYNRALAAATHYEYWG